MIGCIIQARVGSSRLPRKVLMKVDSENSVLEFIIKQLNFKNPKIFVKGFERDNL